MIITYDEPCAKCGGLYCEPCPRCGACGSCDCTPATTTAIGVEGPCEECGERVQAGQSIAVYADDVVVHERCPRPRAQA